MGVNNKTILFVGSGNMAQSIIAGMINAGSIRPANIICNDIVKSKLDSLKEKYGVSVAYEKKEAALTADIIFLAVKPQNMRQSLEEIKPFIKKGAVAISIAAAITTGFIESVLTRGTAVVRAMPNTPAMIGLGATALCAGKNVSKNDLDAVSEIFRSVGIVHIMTEDKFDAVTALSGSGPAYVFYLCELMQNAGEKLGLDKTIARDFAVQTVFGAGEMLAKTAVDAATLRQNVTSPNGTTQAALEYFRTQNISEIVQKAMEQAARRSKELSK